ncbi:MAG TPA: hypothetical protein VLL25_04335 [Acidimicrobiales bacterium]|nr:hypothetical protein [Acidimicrobiales bacterium]
MLQHSLVLPPRNIWPILEQPGYRERCQAILDAIIWMTDGDDLPTAIELVYLAIDDNWTLAEGDVDAIGSAWALRHLIGLCRT